MKKFVRFLVPFLLLLVLIGSTVWYLFVYDRGFTRDMLLGQARYHDLHGNAKISAWFYNLAYEYSGRDENVAIELANQYKNDGNYTKAEVTLSKAINAGGTIELYTALCSTYVEQDKLLDAVNLLENMSNIAIKEQLDAMRPNAPVTDREPGFYNQYIDVAFTAAAGETIYINMDGEYPSVNGTVYAEPISLEAGETTIYAITVSENGLVSPLTIMGYTVAGVIEPAVFMDSAMESAMRTAIGANNSDILYTNELWPVTDFTVPETASTLEDLALMPYLVNLTIENIAIDSLEPLANLARLENLTIQSCSFSPEELSVLAGLPGLSRLTMTDCGLSTIENLKNAPGLTYLNIKSNTIRNLEPLSNMTTLVELDMEHNALTDLSALSNLKNLEILNIAHNAVTDLLPLTNCTKLLTLNAGNNALSTLKGVSDLPLLSKLHANDNDLKDISVVGKCSELTELYLANNEITDISALDALTNLDILDFAYNSVSELPQWNSGCALRTIDGSHNQITSIDSLSTLEQISYVYMDYNKLTSVEALADCYHLVQVNVYGNDIDAVSALTDHNIIVNYDPT